MGRIRHLFSKWLPGLLLLAVLPVYAQHSTKQIDSIFDAVNQVNELKVDIKQVTKAYNAAKSMNYDKGIVNGLVLYAKSSYDSGYYDDAFKYITQAESASVNIRDPVLIFKIRTYKGLCYSRLGFYKEADQTLKTAVSIIKTMTDKEDMHFYLVTAYTDLAVNSGRLAKMKDKVLWGEKAYIESQLLENSGKYAWVAAIAASNWGNRFTKRKQYDSAELYLNKALFLAKKTSNNYKYNRCYAQWVVSLHAGDLYYAQRRFSEAELFYKDALQQANQIKYAHGLKEAYAGLAKVYVPLKRTNEALMYAEKSSKLSDSLSKLAKSAIKAPLDYIISGKEQQLIQNRNKYHRIILLSFLLLLTVIAAVFLYRHKLKKEKKLSSEKINELIKKIELNEHQHSPSKMEELKGVVQLAMNNNPAFLMKFNELDPEFSRKLLNMSPSLIAPEIEFCALLKLNFETKEIARYTKVSVRAVEGKKYRIRKKLNIPSDQDINIWMAHL